MPQIDLAALAARLPSRPLTRFAPSPTGRLHLGHVANAIYVWGVARALGGRVLLRIEDHDRERSRIRYEHAIIEDLGWLGLTPDVVAERQSARTAEYEAALARLSARGLVYACRCSRREIEAAAGTAPELRYPGTCRDLALAPGDGLGVRVRLAPGAERFDDARLGPQTQDPGTQCGDVLVRDRAGHWTYQFAVAVDDTSEHVDLVIRGEDLLPSTGRQIRLARLLGRPAPPAFLHHPLLFAPTGLKLSKSNRDAGIDALRGDGWPPAAVLGLAASGAGLIPRPRPLSPRGLAALFDRAPDGPASSSS